MEVVVLGKREQVVPVVVIVGDTDVQEIPLLQRLQVRKLPDIHLVAEEAVPMEEITIVAVVVEAEVITEDMEVPKEEVIIQQVVVAVPDTSIRTYSKIPPHQMVQKPGMDKSKSPK